jgi:peptidoglycan/xylan/chitin deacetylase (PgdA/CDA1 family)
VPPRGGIAKPNGPARNLRVLNWAGFKGAMSFTFDDSNSSQLEHYPALRALGVPFTFYLVSGKPESGNPLWAQALADGHELGNHSKSHAQQDDGGDTDQATRFIQERFKTQVWTMAAPYGSAVYTDLARTRFLINRGVSDALIGVSGAADPFTLPCYVPPLGADESVYIAKASAALNAGKWQVVLVHGFTGGSDGAYLPVPLDGFVTGVKYARNLGDLWLGTVASIGAYWRGQLAFQASHPVTSGTDTIWNWTLPEHFPPGQFLRVNVDGGTLMQGSAAVPWDSHGYYEISLDAKTLTLRP